MTSASSADAAAGRLTAFAGFQRIAAGPRAEVLAQLRAQALPQDTLVRVFDDATGARLDFDLRAAAATAPGDDDTAPAAQPARGVGRPKLGVVAREVTLLPRHWDWLASQPGGASVALRRLVDEARRAHEGPEARRLAREAAYRFMSEMAGDLTGFEEASRALFAGGRARFEAHIAAWPVDVQAHLGQLSAGAWSPA